MSGLAAKSNRRIAASSSRASRLTYATYVVCSNHSFFFCRRHADAMSSPMAGSSTSVPRTADAAAAGDNQHPKLPPNWQRCHAFMSSKGRYCRASKNNLLPPPPNSSHEGTGEAIYCGNHVHLYGVGAAADGDKVEGKGKKGKRIPCPIDPSHEVYESRLEKHLKVCPAATRKLNDAALPYYQENVNCGGCGYLDIDGCGSDDKEDSDNRPKKRKRSSDNENDAEWAKQLALSVLLSLIHI